MSPSAASNNSTELIPTMSVSDPTEFVILGSGVSTAIPRISCIIRPVPVRCPVCHDALENPASKNRRGNVSAMVRYGGKTILIDCGKTIREAAMRHFPKLGITNIEAIVLTHGHADAILGLDDARDIQMAGKKTIKDGIMSRTPTPTTPIYLNEETMAVCRNVFPYLVPEKDLPVKEGQKKDIKRRTASLSWNAYGPSEYFKPFRPLPDIPVTFVPIPLLHGGTYICMGFVITIPVTQTTKEKVIAYLSDVHEVPDETMTYLKALPRIDLLIIDVLTNSKRNKSHFSKDAGIHFANELRAVETVGVGMTCSIGDHDVVNKELAQLEDDGLKFRLSYDGERFPC